VRNEERRRAECNGVAQEKRNEELSLAKIARNAQKRSEGENVGILD
jgi:hypothetical protein